MARAYSAVHRGTGEWSRKIRKATETKRVRRVVRVTLRNVDLVAEDADNLEARSAGGAEML